MAPPTGELARRPQGGETERGACRNVPNEITIDTYTTKTTKRLFFGHFVAFVETVAFVVFGGYRETVEIVAFVIPLGTVKS